ncbi:MAG TPA: class II aldolase/adducin family protein [Rhizobiaceae bacterium]|nr:class II aldolase/adducin family protein [Rhizobiaceae bacterium]
MAPPNESTLRIDLAAAFRLAARHGWHEAVATHFSAAVSPDGTQFLVNPRWRHFSAIRASELMLVDADDQSTMDRPDAPDPSAWSIHSAIHRNLPQARVVLHLHPPHATALASLKDPSILPIDQNTARFYNRIAVDMNFGGIATEEAEGERIASTIGNRKVLMMANHGVTVIGETVGEAFDTMYYLEKAAQTMILALSKGRPLNVMADDLAEATAAGWDDYKGADEAHFAELKRMLDREGSDYAA